MLNLIEIQDYMLPLVLFLKAGYNSAENKYARLESDGLFYSTIQANTKGGGSTTGNYVILHGGNRDKDKMDNNDPGNNYDSLKLLDVGNLNTGIIEYWFKFGISD